MMNKIFYILIVLIVLPTAVLARKSKKAPTVDIDSLVQSRDFVINVNRVYPQGGYDTSRFNPTGKLIVRNDSVNADLPFFGESHVSRYGDTDLGIKVNCPLDEESVTKRKKYIEMEFTSIDKNNETMRFYVRAFDGGDCTIDIVSSYRSHISYSGTIGKP